MPIFLKNKAKLNFAERLLAKVKSSQVKLRYRFREYHFTGKQLRHSAPEEKDTSSLFKIHNSLNTLYLAPYLSHLFRYLSQEDGLCSVQCLQSAHFLSAYPITTPKWLPPIAIGLTWPIRWK